MKKSYFFYIDKMHKRKHYRDQHIYRIVGNDKMIFFYICLPCFNTLMSVKGAHLSLLVNLIKNIVRMHDFMLSDIQV